MAHYGALCNPAPSHLMSIVALGHELQNRGHRFTVFAAPDLRESVLQHGIQFCSLDNSSNYLPGLDKFLEAAARENFLSYRDLLRFGIGEIRLYCEKAPAAMREMGVQCLISDQVVIPARSVAERLRIPFITVCSALPMGASDRIPERAGLHSMQARLRNWITAGAINLFSLPFSQRLNSYRRQWGLAPHKGLRETFSTLAQITQLVSEFDLPNQRHPSNLFYVGPYQREDLGTYSFPYDQLDRRPLIYSSLGTLLGATPGIWQKIAESCLGLEAQLVISLGGRGRPEDYSQLPGHPLVVSFAPQRTLLKRASLMIGHAGLNSTMEALAEGVPVVSLPGGAGDQPGVALRVAASGAGEVLPLKSCSTGRLRPLVQSVLYESKYRERASVLQRAIQKSGGVREAADIVERISGGQSRSASR